MNMSEVRVRSQPNPFEQHIPESYQYLKGDVRRLRLVFHHPGYFPKDDTLFFLYAWDNAEGGLHYGLAHNACAIIANNRHDGWFTSAREGPRMEAGPDEILPAGDYWFHVPQPGADATAMTANNDLHDDNEQIRGAYRWPIVTCFQDWEFPSVLPPVWTRIHQERYPPRVAPQSQFAQAVQIRDVTCRISMHHTGTEVAHLCPKHEMNWFLSNGMSQYNVNNSLDPNSLTNDPCNALLLRSDLHSAFDERQFTFFPKSPQGYAVHMLESTRDIGPLYHNTLLHPITDCAVEFLYARFAWAIFPSLSGFLGRPGIKRSVIIVRSNENGTTREAAEIADKTKIKATASASRSNSPQKRSRAEYNYAKDGGDIDSDEQYESRGRKRRRTNSYSSLSLSPNATNSIQQGWHESFAVPSFSTNDDDLPIATTSPLPLPSEEDIEQIVIPNRLDFSTSPPPTYSGQKEIHRLRQEALAKQRPADFQPPNFDRRMPAVQALEMMGYDIIYDEEDDLDVRILEK